MPWAEAEMLLRDLLPENKPGSKPFHPKEHSALNFFGHIESIGNLSGVETHWQDNWRKLVGLTVDQGKRQAALMGGVLQRAAP